MKYSERKISQCILPLRRLDRDEYFRLTPFFYKQSIFDTRPENCVSFSKKSS